jgi:Undecaprenyl-phosphate glucose phosphotransferase
MAKPRPPEFLKTHDKEIALPHSAKNGQQINQPQPEDDGTRMKLAETALQLSPSPAASSVVVAGLWRIIEAVLLTIAGAVVYFLYVYKQIGWEPVYAIAIPGIALAAIFSFQAFETYQIAALRKPVAYLPRIIVAWVLVFLLAFTAVFFLKLEGLFSRVFMGSWFWIGLLVLMIARFLLSLRIMRMTLQGQLDRRTAIVGSGEAVEKLIWSLKSDPDSDIKLVGIFDDRLDARSPEVIAGYAKLGTVEDLVEYARHTRLDLVIFAMPITAEARLLTMLRKLWILPIDVRLAAHSQRLRFRPRNYSYISGIPVLDMVDKPIADWDVVMKWLFDKIIGISLLIISSPLLVILALLVKFTSRGPVFFRQKRYGFNNELIEVYKFRSMYEAATDMTASKLVTKNDPRVTPVGRFLRKTSLDELPQLLNVVFFGNISLVGPRPHAVHAKAENRLYDQVVDGYFARHRVKPGITGLAQINGWRGETDTEEKIQRRVEFDLQYIENWSLWMDMEILIRTPFSLLNAENAY